MRMKRVLALVCCAVLAMGGFSGAVLIGRAETKYVLADMPGFDEYNRVTLAMVGISGAKSPQPATVAMPGEGVEKSVRVTAIASEDGNSFSIASCRAPDTAVADAFVNGVHIEPVASGKTYNVFAGTPLVDSVGIRFCLATGPKDSVTAFAGKARLQFGVAPARGESTAEVYSEYEEGFVFETPDYPIGADGFVCVPFEDAYPIDRRTPDGADFLRDYLPRVNAVNVIVTPDAALVEGDFYYIGGFRAYREQAEYSVYATTDGVCGGVVTVSGLSEHEGALELKMDGEAMPAYFVGSTRVDSYGLNRVDYVIDTGVVGDGMHDFELLLDGEPVCEQRLCFDNTPPYLAYSSIANGSVASARGVVSMRAADGESGVTDFSVKLDGKAITLPYSYSGLTAGAHSLTYSITDRANLTQTGAVVFTVTDGVYYGGFNAGEGSVSVNVSAANGQTAYLYTMNGALPVTAYENAAELSALGEKTPEGESATSVGAGTVTVDEKYPYQAFEVDVSGVTGGSVSVSAAAAANVGETLCLDVYNETSSAWEEVDRERMTAASVTLSGSVQLADRVSEGKVKFRIRLLSVDNGADTFTWCTDAQHMIQHNYEDGTYRDYTYYVRDQFNLFIREYNEGKIGYVINTGDISDEPNNAAMFAECRDISNILDEANIPNGVVAGNHDANWINWCEFYGARYYDYQDWWGGAYGDNKGHYDLVTVGGRDLVVVCLGWTLENDADATAWARQVYNTYPNRTGILAVHGYLGTDGEILFNTAKKFWQIAEDCPNLNIIICGHEPGTARNIRYTQDGRPVLEMLHDYQSGSPSNMWWKWLEGGSGLFRYVTIGDGTITNRTFTISKEDYKRVYGRDPDKEDGYYYYWDKDEENFTMPVRLVRNERRVKTLSFTAFEAMNGENAASVSVSGGKASFNGVTGDLWYVICGGTVSAVYPASGGNAAAQPLVTGAYGANGTLTVRWELPEGASADKFEIRADGALLAEVGVDAREYVGALAREAGETASVTVTSVSGTANDCSEPRSVTFSGVSFTAFDADGDGEIAVADALAAMRFALGLNDGITAKTWFAADADGDGAVTASDALLILKKAAGLN